jgi:ABC-type antimicrobial peptide transport system permease subunit
VKPCIGLYGVVSYVAARKTNETSIRLALGATRVQVLGSVLKEGMLLVIAGMAISVPATLAATRLITSLLFGVKAADLNSLGLNTPVVRIGWPNRFIEHGKLDPLHAKSGITPETAIEKLRPYLKIHQPQTV